MSPTSTGENLPLSVLQRSFSLSELIDAQSFRDVCQSYAELFQINFKVFDRSGELLADVRGNSGDYCAYLFQFPQGKAMCMNEVTAIRDLELQPGRMAHYTCFTGQRYAIHPITHEGDILGRVVYGPFLQQGDQLAPLPDLGEKFNRDIAERLTKKIRRANESVVHKVVFHLVQFVEVLVYTGYKQMLTSRMHVESVTTSYTELQKKNQQLRDSFERLKELDRLKSSFLATVSHELRTPLTSVIGYSEMLIEGLAGDLNGEQREYVKTIMEKGENLLSLIASILDYSKLESGNIQIAPAETDIGALVDAAVSTVLPMARKSEIEVISELEPNLPRLKADAGKLRQALVNIMGNAVKFNRKGGTVKVAACRIERPRRTRSDDMIPAALAPPDEPFLCIAVSDTGIGIPEDKLQRVFDSFYQVDGSSTREYGGTGLGLAISASYIEAHGGKIELESVAGQGSTFSILLPLEQRD